MNDLVSIILPVYNRAHTLPDCISSILAQTHQNFQVILIDDGSADATVQLCQDYARSDPRFHLIQGTHNGVSAARNLGLDAAKGDFLFFLDSDDAIHFQLLQTLVDAMIAQGTQIGATPILRVSQEKWDIAMEKFPRQAACATTKALDEDASIAVAFESGSALRAIGGTMLRRELIGQTRFRTDLTIGEDFFFLYENLIKGAKTTLLDQRWYYCRLHDTNSSFNYSLISFDSRFIRRKLVWTSEEALGRMDNARQQKQEAFSIFLDHLNEDKMPKADRDQMCRTIKTHRNDLLPTLSFIDRLQFRIFTVFPGLFSASRIFKKK
ncbi:MAG: glycosyltransferase family 2 protein [Oscillospiraceae bacterium]|nr:glycosyltransferase family 2 protein [Oscillospiraceae bacterium]